MAAQRNLLITPLILTYNESPNIARTLDRLSWAKRVLVVDSFSDDETLAILEEHSNVKVLQREFVSFASQCNYGLSQIETDWVLSLDADYVFSNELVSVLETMVPSDDFAGFSVPFVYCINGRPLRSSLYPRRTVLYRRDRARYYDEGHGHRVAVKGRIEALSAPIYHDDRKPLNRWFQEQIKYADRESVYLLQRSEIKEAWRWEMGDGGQGRQTKDQGPGTGESEVRGQRSEVGGWRSDVTLHRNLSLQDRIRLKIVLAPILVFFYTLFWKRLILDGWPGWFYVFQRTLAEVMLSLKLIEAKLSNGEREGKLKALGKGRKQKVES